MFDDILPKPVKQYNYTFGKGTVDIDFIEKTVRVKCHKSSDHNWETMKGMFEIINEALHDDSPFYDLSDVKALLKDGWRFS